MSGGRRYRPGRIRPGWLGPASGAAATICAGYWVLMSPFSQLLGSFPYRGAADAKVVALTFDDGPNEPFTTQIVDFLGERGIHATFFQVGRCVQAHPGVTARLAAAGHVIGNHSYSHRFSRCWGRRAQLEEITATQEILRRELGRPPALYRPPWLLRVPPLLVTIRRRSLRAVSGEFCHPLEVFQPAPERLARAAVRKVRPGSILIFHDGFDGRGGNRGSTVAAVKIVATRLLADGYRFTTVDRLLGIPAYLDEQP